MTFRFWFVAVVSEGPTGSLGRAPGDPETLMEDPVAGDCVVGFSALLPCDRWSRFILLPQAEIKAMDKTEAAIAIRLTSNERSTLLVSDLKGRAGCGVYEEDIGSRCTGL